MPKRKRQPSCMRPEYLIAREFPNKELSFPECKTCLVLRQEGAEYLCGRISHRTGRYVSPLTSFPKRVTLSDRMVVDGASFPAGTVLTVLEPAADSEGYWCKVPRRGRPKRPAVLIKRDQIEGKS